MICGWLNLRMQNHGFGGPTMGLDHVWILVSAAGPGSNPQQVPWDNSTCFSTAQGSKPLTPGLFKDQLYFKAVTSTQITL